jgi:RNA polymerase sigma-70 factor (ECF subfamily)
MNELAEKTSTQQIGFRSDDRAFVYAVARRIVRDEAAAEDVAQDAMLLAFRYRDSFRGASKYRTWLYRIATTAALSYLRKRRRSREQLSPDDQDLAQELADPSDSAEDTLLERERAAHAQHLLAQLPPKYRDVLVLRAERSVAETAAEMGISVANVKVRTHRAVHQLRAVAA